MANISRKADPIFSFFFFKCAEFNLESQMSGQIFDISHSFSEKLEKLIFRPRNHEIGNTAKFWRDGTKRMPDSDSATKNYMKITGYVSGQFWLLTCVINWFFNVQLTEDITVMENLCNLPLKHTRLKEVIRLRKLESYRWWYSVVINQGLLFI